MKKTAPKSKLEFAYQTIANLEAKIKELQQNKFHPTPTEAEINEATEWYIKQDFFRPYNDYLRIQLDKTFKDGIQWLQQYQTSALCKTYTSMDIDTKIENVEPTKNSPSCTLSDDELVIKAKEWLQRLIDTGGRGWSLPVPANPNKDVDLILFEIVHRFQKQASQPNQAIAAIELLKKQLAEYMEAPDTEEEKGFQAGIGVAFDMAKELLKQIKV